MKNGSYIRTEEFRKKASEARKGRKLSEEHKRKISIKLKGKSKGVGRKFSKEARLNMSKARIGNTNSKGRKLSDEHKEKLRIAGKKFEANLTEEQKIIRSELTSGINNSFYNKKHNEKTKEKLKIESLKRFIKSGQCLSIGKHETQLLDEQELKDNCKILRQYQIDKYIVDGYCQETNIVYEVYEKKHSQKKRKEYDLKRQKEIEEKLKCEVKIIWDL